MAEAFFSCVGGGRWKRVWNFLHGVHLSVIAIGPWKESCQKKKRKAKREKKRRRANCFFLPAHNPPPSLLPGSPLRRGWAMTDKDAVHSRTMYDEGEMLHIGG
ncbi:hypothetical protein TEQG_06028 [Trichophyton equinum CBS 127.97]|uniref:Uncharacterized protein n=1 Tax=Trichophyton equinum (strain ATCC MYA-4606 / CBS 127.97) TaxID=559882 RepID=F2PYS1_TRIEC|nr:hypothetical protein TEQG_06028 [Trichophyton equinum CBS 127.97]